MAHDPNKLFFSFSRRVAELRKAKGYTQDFLAEKAGVTGGYIRLLESGQQNVTLSTISKLSDLLGCEPKSFFEKHKTPKPKPGRPTKRK